MSRRSREQASFPDPFSELEAECLDDEGMLDPVRVKMALRLAYRRGFQQCNDIYRGAFPRDLECPVPYPQFPSRESDRIAARAAVADLLKHPQKGGGKHS